MSARQSARGRCCGCASRLQVTCYPRSPCQGRAGDRASDTRWRALRRIDRLEHHAMVGSSRRPTRCAGGQNRERPSGHHRPADRLAQPPRPRGSPTASERSPATCDWLRWPSILTGSRRSTIATDATGDVVLQSVARVSCSGSAVTATFSAAGAVCCWWFADSPQRLAWQSASALPRTEMSLGRLRVGASR